MKRFAVCLLLVPALVRADATVPQSGLDRVVDRFMRSKVQPDELVGARGLAGVTANCGENDEPRSRAKRICGAAVGRALAWLREFLRERERGFEDGWLTCAGHECVVDCVGEGCDRTRLVFSTDGRRQLLGWFGWCPQDWPDRDWEAIARRRFTKLAATACP